MKTIAIITASLLPIFGLTSCETMNGLGKDIQKAGEGLENASAPVQQAPASTSSALPTTSSTPPQ